MAVLILCCTMDHSANPRVAACCHHTELGLQEAALGCWHEEKHHCEAFVEFSHTLACHWHWPSSRFGGLFREKRPTASCLEKNSLQGLAWPHQARSSAIYRWRDWVHLGVLFLSLSNFDPGCSSFCANLFSCQYLNRAEIELNVLIQLHLLQAGLPAGVGVMSHCCPAPRHRRALWGCWLCGAPWAQWYAHSFSLVRYQNTKRQQIEFTLLIAFI